MRGGASSPPNTGGLSLHPGQFLPPGTGRTLTLHVSRPKPCNVSSFFPFPSLHPPFFFQRWQRPSASTIRHEPQQTKSSRQYARTGYYACGAVHAWVKPRILSVDSLYSTVHFVSADEVWDHFGRLTIAWTYFSSSSDRQTDHPPHHCSHHPPNHPAHNPPLV